MNTESVLGDIQRYDMIQNGDDVMVCVSGGADSMALLSFLLKFKERLGIRELFACHFNHGLRGEESDSDEQLVRDFCSRHQVRLVVGYGNMNEIPYPKGEGTETFARTLRYRFFEKSVGDNPKTKIAIAHTKEDAAETVLFRLVRGTGPKGIRGILPVRDTIIRPLLFTSRANIETYCAENVINYAIDRTNSDESYARNRIRRKVIPQLQEINRNAIENIQRFSVQSMEAWNYVEKEALALLEKAAVVNGYSISVLRASDAFLQKTAIQILLEEQDIAFSEQRINEVFRSLAKKKCQIQLSAIHYVQIENDVVNISGYSPAEKDIVAEAPFDLQGTWFNSWYVNSTLIEQNQLREVLNYRLKTFDNLLDCGKISGNLVLRTRKDGDRFQSAVRKQTKSLKKIMNEKKVPDVQRWEMPILWDDAGIVWVHGEGVAERVSIDADTVSALRIECEKRI